MIFRSHGMNTCYGGIILILLLMGSACGADQAAQQLEIAQLEERQQNLAHAKELYEQILQRYPESPAAQTARTRLAKLAEKP
jgi:outer membrane protein assembly factor BamD (BamD/ComL family)